MAEEDTQGAIPPKQTPPTPPAAPAAGSPIARKPVIMRKPTLRKPGEAAPAPAAPAAPAVPPAPAPSAPAPQGITIPREEAAKKMTARISLASATGQIPSVAVPASTDDVKTIKLKAPTVAIPAMPEQDSAAIAAQAAKSKTSRISLESAFSAQPELPSAGGAAPKTIRLKRPTEMGGAPAKPPLKPPTTHIEIPLTPHQTGQVPAAAVAAPPPEAAAESPDNSPTRKKTIKVKRPGAGSGPKISLNKGEGGDAASGADDDNLQQLTGFDNLAPIAGPDKVNPIFIVAAVIAILVAIDLVWVLAAQLFGPNAAVADYTKAQGPDVPNPPFALVVE